MTVYYIATTGDNGTGDGSEGNPWETLLFAFNNSIAADTIIAADGEYAFENTTWNSNRTIQGTSQSGTIFDGAGASLKWIISSATINFLDLTIRDIVGSNVSGVIENASAVNDSVTTWTRCTFDDLSVPGQLHFAQIFLLAGGGTPLRNAMTFTSCVFDECFAADGNPAYMWNGTQGSGHSLTLTNCTLYFSTAGAAAIESIFFNRSAVNPVYTVKNCIIYNASGTSMEVFNENNPVAETFSNNCYFDDFTMLPTDANAVLTDPLLVDPANDNFNLRPTSPCIDTGVLI